MKIKRLIVLIVVIILFTTACSEKKDNSTQESDSSISTESTKEVNEEQAKEIALSWYKSNHYMYNSADEDKYSIKIITEDDVYGKESYLFVLFFEGKHHMALAVTKENGELYMDYGINNYVPLEKLKILNDSKNKKQAKLLLEKKFKKKDDVAYIDIIEKEGVRYFLYGEFNSENLQKIYMIDMETEETFLWELETNTLIKEELTNSQDSYKTLLEELNASANTYEFLTKDLDGDDILELIVKENLKLTVYKNGTKAEQIGNYDFATGTTRFFASDNKDYQGIFCFYVSGGLNHYGYINVEENRLKVEELWNEDYSGISEEAGEKRNRIEEISKDKKLIEESKKVYHDNCELTFLEVKEDNISKLE